MQITQTIELTDTRYEWIGPTGVRFVQTPSPAGLWFKSETPAEVRRIIDHAYRTGLRVRLFHGDTETGRAWPEEWHTIGTISRSTGQVKDPLLIERRNSSGGMALLDSVIVGIQTGPGEWAYRHPALDLGAWTVGRPSVGSGMLEAAFHNGSLHAQFQRAGQAARYCAFMRGERWAK